MPLIREFILIGACIGLGLAYSLFTGLGPKPWAAPELVAGEIRIEDTTGLEIIWLDARSADAYADGHLAGALWFDPENWDESLILITEHWLNQPRPIIVYCDDAACGTSREIAEQLRAALPAAEIYSLHGGWHQ